MAGEENIYVSLIEIYLVGLDHTIFLLILQKNSFNFFIKTSSTPFLFYFPRSVQLKNFNYSGRATKLT